MSRWHQKVVAITGGTAGFGLALARAFGRAGAKVVVLSRDPDRRDAALAELAAEGIDGAAFEIDMSGPDAGRRVANVVDQIVASTGKLDAWVNNVGVSTRVDLSEATHEDFQRSLDQNLFTALHGAQAALPHLLASRGHLIQVGSLASRIAWPHVGPYTVSKHALAGLTEQFRAEYGDQIHVMLVCPGPLERADAGTRYATTAESSASARLPAAGAPVSLLDPDALANAVVRAASRRQNELMVPAKARWLLALQRCWPSVGDWFLARAQSKRR